MHCNNLRLVLGLGLVRVSSRIRIKLRVSVMVRVSIRATSAVNFALFRCYQPVIYTRPQTCKMRMVLRIFLADVTGKMRMRMQYYNLKIGTC